MEYFLHHATFTLVLSSYCWILLVRVDHIQGTKSLAMYKQLILQSCCNRPPLDFQMQVVNVNIVTGRKCCVLTRECFLSLRRRETMRSLREPLQLRGVFTSCRSRCRSCQNPCSSPRRCGRQTLLHECHFSVGNNTGFSQGCWDWQLRGSVHVYWQRTMGKKRCFVFVSDMPLTSIAQTQWRT